MKMFIRFGCGDILETEAKAVGGGDYRIVTPDGPMYVRYAMVFNTREEAEANCHKSKLAGYKQVFRKPTIVKPMYEWNVQRLDGTVVENFKMPQGDLTEFLSVLQPDKPY